MSEQNANVKQRIEMDEKVKFETNMSSRYTTTMALCEEVNDLFSAAFPDYIGCKIFVNDGSKGYIAEDFKNSIEKINNNGTVKTRSIQKGLGNLYVDITFKYSGYKIENYGFDKCDTFDSLNTALCTEEADYLRTSIIPISAENAREKVLAEEKNRLVALKIAEERGEAGPKGKSIAEITGQATTKNTNIMTRYLNVTDSRFKTGATYKVLKHTYEMLEEFMPLEERTNWNKHTYESPNNIAMYNTKEEVVVTITGLDLEKIMKKIYGSADENGIYDYACFPSSTIANRMNDYIVICNRLDNNAITELVSSIHAYGPNNSNIVRCR